MARTRIDRHAAARGTAAALLLVPILASCGGQVNPSTPEWDSQTRYVVPIGDSPVRGPSTAWVTVVEFADFQCPYCRAVQPVVEQLRETYGDQLRLVYKFLPIPTHTWAEPAAELAVDRKSVV